MPEPRKGERKKDFIKRCMDSEESKRTFPKPDQRRAFCESQWERRENRYEKG